MFQTHFRTGQAIDVKEVFLRCHNQPTSCKLCDESFGPVQEYHFVDHSGKIMQCPRSGLSIIGCRLRTAVCKYDSSKPGRYHFHCPFCLMSNKAKILVTKHIDDSVCQKRGKTKRKRTTVKKPTPASEPYKNYDFH